MLLKDIVHYTLHFLIPWAIAWGFFRPHWQAAGLQMVLANLIDLDHLLAWPDVFVAGRCSIGFHPLHTGWAIGVYVLLLFFPKTRWLAIGLVLHILTDALDCWWAAGFGF